MTYQSIFTAKAGSGTAAPAKTGGGYKSILGITQAVGPSQQELADQRTQQQAQDAADKATQQQLQKVQAQQAKANQQPTSLFGKAKATVSGIVHSAADTTGKAVNTVAGGVAGIVGVDTALVQRAKGDKAGAQRTLNATTDEINQQLSGKGAAGNGSYLTPTEAKKGGKSLIKPGAQAVTDIAPYVLPVGGKATSLFGKVVDGAAANGVVSGASNAANQKLQTGKVDVNQVINATKTGAELGAALPVAGHVLGKTLTVGSTSQAKLFLARSQQEHLLDNVRPPEGVKPAIEAPAPAPNTIPAPVLADDAARRPAPVAVDQSVAPLPTPEEATKSLIGQAKIEHPVFQQTMKGVSKDLGLKYTPGPVKDEARAITKVAEHYGGDHTLLKDTVRGTIEVPDHSKAGFQKVIDTIKQKYPDATVKDGYKDYKNGYVDMKVNVKTPSGHPAEIILATPEMLEAKNKLGGHDLYEISRDQTKSEAERKAAGDQMQTLYSNAHDAANKRLASEADLPAASKTEAALASDTGRAPSSKAPTSLEAPDTTTVSRNNPDGSVRTASTTSSGVTKNSGLSISKSVAEKDATVKGEERMTPVADVIAEKRAALGKDTTASEKAAPSIPEGTRTTPKVDEVANSKFKSRVYERLQKEQPEALKDDVGYKAINLKEDAAKAADIVATDKNKAYRIALGIEDDPSVTSTAVNIAMSEKALEEGNVSLYSQLVKSRSLTQTRRGQEIVAEKGSVTDNSTSRYVKELLQSRLGKLGKGYLSDLHLPSAKNKTPAQRAVTQIDKQVTVAQKTVKRSSNMKIQQAQDLIDSLAC